MRDRSVGPTGTWTDGARGDRLASALARWSGVDETRTPSDRHGLRGQSREAQSAEIGPTGTWTDGARGDRLASALARWSGVDETRTPSDRHGLRGQSREAQSA